MTLTGTLIIGPAGEFNFQFDQDCTIQPGSRYAFTLLRQPDLSALRQLRLYHWRQVCKLSDSLCSGRGTEMGRIEWRNRHAEHLGAVQVLNDLFPIGDTAARDAATMQPRL